MTVDVHAGLRKLEGPKEAKAAAKAEAQKYNATFVQGANTAYKEITAAKSKLSGVPEAQTYLETAPGKINSHLRNVIYRGRQIIEAHEKGEPLPTMSDLRTTLKNELSRQKKAVESFKILEEIEKKDLKEIETANDKINDSPGYTNPQDVFKSKQKLLDKLHGLSPKFTSTAASRSYAKKVTDKFKELNTTIGDEKSELAMGPSARYKSLQDFFKAVEKYAQLVEEAKANPSKEANAKVKAQEAIADPSKAHKEIFDGKDEGTFAYIKNLYAHMEGDHAETKLVYESSKKSFTGFELVEKTLADAENILKTKGRPAIEEVNKILADKKLSLIEKRDKLVKSADTAIDELAKAKIALKGIPHGTVPEGLTEHHKMLVKATDDLLGEMRKIKLYYEKRDFAHSDKNKEYLIFNEKTGEIKNKEAYEKLSDKEKDRISSELLFIRKKILDEIGEKCASSEIEKKFFLAKRELANGDWIYAKQLLLEYARVQRKAHTTQEVSYSYDIAENKTIAVYGPRKWDDKRSKEEIGQNNETEKILKQITLMEIAQSRRRLHLIKTSLAKKVGRHNNKSGPYSSGRSRSHDCKPLYT